ncbi:MAG: phosphoribosylanthranilate isomerase [Candidatus Aquicultor sp.]|nr:phosphoribosylanthranilate isomerase [Candidatus Aquicultor sp.]
MTRVKICGITNKEDALLAVELGAHALGFVFADSPRRIEPDQALEVIDEVSPFVAKVGVFVNTPVGDVQRIADYCNLDAVQLHGDETPEYCGQLQVKTIKAFRMRNYTEIEEWLFREDEFEAETLLEPCKNVKAFLVDAYAKGLRGGTGIHLNWELVRNLESRKPIILAGGLDPKNVALAIKVVKPYAVDVSSGVELRPGKKDKYKLREFMKAVCECDH